MLTIVDNRILNSSKQVIGIVSSLPMRQVRGRVQWYYTSKFSNWEPQGPFPNQQAAINSLTINLVKKGIPL